MAKQTKKEKVFVSAPQKSQAIQHLSRGEKTRREVAAELGVALATVNLWMAKENRKAIQQPSLKPSHLTPENGLQHRIAVLELENEYLRKRLALYEPGNT